MKKILNVGSHHVNAWLLPLEEGWCLVDTGYKQDEERFWKKLAKNKINPTDIRYVIITHHHADHAGFLASVLQKTGAELISSEKNMARLRAGMNDCYTYVSTFPVLVASTFTTLFLDTFQCFSPVNAPFLDSTTQPLSSSGIRFFALEGHTECDLCFTVDDKLFCGDILMSGVGSFYHAPCWIKNKFDLVRSWNKILGIPGIRTIYPGHGKPFSLNVLPSALHYWSNKGVLRLHKSNH